MKKLFWIVLTALVITSGAWAQIWNETGDAPSFPDGPAQVTRGHGALTAIVGATASAGGDLRDAYCVRIADPGAFLATTDPATDPGASANFDTRLFLFRPDGAPVLANDNTPAAPGLMSTVTGVATDGSGFVLSQPGEYVLIVGGFSDDPQDLADTDLFDIESNHDAVHTRNPAAGHFIHWEGGSPTTGTYTIVLGGVEHCQDDLDAVFANGALQSNRVCLSNGAGGLACSIVSVDTNSTQGVALGFVDGDKNLDAVFANCCGQRNQVCLGTGTGGFNCSDVSTGTSNTIGVAMGFVDDDQNLDAVFANLSQRNRLCLGLGNGTFNCSDVSVDTNSTKGVALGFVNSDQHLDAIFANDGSRNRHCLGFSNGGFSCNDVSSDTNSSLGVALGYVDGDPHLDAVFANNGQSNRICLGIGLGPGGFGCSDAHSDTNNSQGVALGFFDSDEDLDAVFANADNQRNGVCLGRGDGTFICNIGNNDANDTRGVALGFVDDDQNLDAVFANSIQRNRICLGLGTGSFNCSDASIHASSTAGVALGELDFGEIFADGFESGNTLAWSNTVP